MLRLVQRRRASLALTAALVGIGLPLHPAAPAVAGTTTVPKPDHVVIVVEENHSETNILGNPDAPYINSLANNNANFTQSYAVTHPSQPNYLALFSGSTQGVTDDSCPHSFTTTSLGDELLAAGRTFVGYSETMPSAGYTGCGSGKYAAKHNPWVDFPTLQGAATNQTLSTLPTDFTQLPDVSFVIPNLTDDMHDGTVAQGDAWLQANLGAYVTWAQTHNSLFILTFDEDDNGSANRIPTIMAGQRVTPGTYTETINHYSVLRTIQDAFGLAPLANSAAASPVLDVWTPGDGNTAPSAAFTSSCTDLGCSFDATGSSDGDGQVVSYAWTYGDGTTGTGVSPSHTYAAAGTYSVKLTVADNGGATDTVTHQVTVTAPTPPPNQPFAADTFARTVATGWGSADTGGAWTTTSATAFSVAPATGGAIKHATKGSQVSASLPGASSNDTDLTLGFNVDKANAGYYLTVVGRRASSGNEYQARIALNTNNTVNAWLTKVVGGTQTSMVAERTVPGLTYTAGTTLRLRLQVTGTAPSTIRVKVWPATSTEPTTWFATTTDTTTALQNPGSLALISYLSSASTTAPVTTHLTDLTASHTS